MDSFTRAYIECALWSSTDDNEAPLDRNYTASDIAPETLVKMVADCAAFQAQAGDAITSDNHVASEYSADELAGHDFWLTRNGHGAGFWDGDWSEPAATQLDAAAKSFGSCDLYIGDDGQIYAS